MLVRAWRTARGDSAALDALYGASARRAEPPLVGAVERAAAGRRRPELVRVYAIALLDGWLRPNRWPLAPHFRRAARDATVRCSPSEGWSEGDTLRVCAVFISIERSTDPMPPRPGSRDSARIRGLGARNRRA